MGGGSGYSLPKKKSASGKPSTQNTDITVFAGEQFSGNSETFEASNSQFKTSFDISFKEPVKSIIVAGLSPDILKHGEGNLNIFPSQVIHGFSTRSRPLLGDPRYWRRGSKFDIKKKMKNKISPL